MVDSQQQRSDAVGVLRILDGQRASGFYWYLTLLACTGGFLFGYDTSVVGSVLNFIPYKLSDLATGYLVAGASLGAAVGAIIAGPLTDRFGRKSLLVVDALIYAIAALLSAVTVSASMLIVSRTLIGLAVGADSAIATAYIAEFAPANKRGGLSIIQQWMITVGILVSYLIALLVFAVAPHAVGTIDWRIVFGLGALPALIALALRTRMPESPRWLLHRGRYPDAREAFGKLGIDVTEDQVRDTADELEEQARRQERQRRWTPGVTRALIIVCIFFVFQQITGINVPFYYGPKLLGGLFQSGGALNSAMAGLQTAAILGAVNVIATFFAFRYIDRIGRRKLALGGFGGMVIFMVLAACGVAFLTGPAKIVVVMIGFALFIASFAIGVGGTGWLIQGEYFPTSVRGRAASGAATVNWLSNFAIVVIFPTLNTAIGLSWVMIVLAALALLAVIFVARWLPETKNLSVEQVVEVFERQQAT
ncbi:MAG: sugar porter family MFS transporter [Microlunatus sp.]|nr:sugar porter family MFS transporter [Microlunatus sp.]